jgi:phosphoribosylanthranilate isomerase
MMPVRTKICGITSAADAMVTANAGADAIGLVFYNQSARSVTIDQARQIIQALPPFICVVGLFVDPEPAWVKQVLAALAIDLLQFHGNESADFCHSYGRPYLKAVRVKKSTDITHALTHYTSAQGILLDSYDAQKAGGTGQSFAWQTVPENIAKPLILAGGLTPANVQRAIQQVQPYGVDVSTGVEQSPGVKDPQKVIDFIRLVHEV